MNVAYLITTYNRPKSLKRLVKKLDGDIYIVDDGSKPRAKVTATKIIYQENKGKPGYYETVTTLWNMVKDKHYDYYIMLQDDFMPVDGFLKKAIQTWININQHNKICLNLYTDIGRYMKPCWNTFQPVDLGFVIKSQWVEMCFLCERNFFEVLDWEVRQSLRDWDKNPELGSGVGSDISRRLFRRGYNMYQVKNSLFTVQEDGFYSKMNITNSNADIYKVKL